MDSASINQGPMSERAKTLQARLIWMEGTAFYLLIIACTAFSLAHSESPSPEISTIVQSPTVKEIVDDSWRDRNSINAAYSNATSSDRESDQQTPVQFRTLTSGIQSKPLRVVLGLENDASYSGRVKGLYLLKSPLSSTDLQWLYGFLASSAKISGLGDSAEHALKDGIIVFLINDAQALPQTIEILRQIYLDQNQDPTIRSYAVQYLASSMSHLADGSQKQAIQQLLVNLANNPVEIASGTALLGLEQSSMFLTSGVKENQITQIALKVACDPRVPDVDRMHPLQVCGQMGIEQAAPVARDLAVNGTHAMVRMSALATLGELGQATDIPLLTQASNDPDIRIRTAASAALATLQARLKK